MTSQGGGTLTSQGDTMMSHTAGQTPAEESSPESDVPQIIESDSEGVNVVVPKPSKRGAKSSAKKVLDS